MSQLVLRVCAAIGASRSRHLESIINIDVVPHSLY